MVSSHPPHHDVSGVGWGRGRGTPSGPRLPNHANAMLGATDTHVNKHCWVVCSCHTNGFESETRAPDWEKIPDIVSRLCQVPKVEDSFHVYRVKIVQVHAFFFKKKKEKRKGKREKEGHNK